MRKIPTPLLFIWILFSVALVTAQGTCSALIEDALRATDENCIGLDRNMACYGHHQVEAEFAFDVPEGFFINPADVTNIIDLETITTIGLDEAADIWGVAVMNIQANLPDTLPGQNVTFVLMGNAEVENAVPTDEAFIATSSIAVVAALEANVRSGPGLNFEVVRRVPASATLPADGVSADREWVRVVTNDRIAWMARSVLVEDAMIDDLPAFTPELRSPMQAFYLRTGIGSADCQAAPDDMLLVQGPEDIEIDLTVNGASFRIGSTVSLRLLAEDEMELTVIDGHAEMLDENFEPTGDVIQAGQSTTACLGDPDNRGTDGEANDRIVECDFSPPEWIDTASMEQEWCQLERVPSGLLNYPVDLICAGEILPTPLPPTPEPPPPPPPPPPVVNEPPLPSDPGVPAAGDICSSFGLIGPLSNITPRPTVFSWTAAPGADNYQIAFFDYQGNQAQTFSTPATSIEINVGQVPTGSELSWQVTAFANGGVICTTGRTQTIFRLADPLAPPPPSATPVPARPTATPTPVPPFTVDYVTVASVSPAPGTIIPYDAPFNVTVQYGMLTGTGFVAIYVELFTNADCTGQIGTNGGTNVNVSSGEGTVSATVTAFATTQSVGSLAIGANLWQSTNTLLASDSNYSARCFPIG